MAFSVEYRPGQQQLIWRKTPSERECGAGRLASVRGPPQQTSRYTREFVFLAVLLIFSFFYIFVKLKNFPIFVWISITKWQKSTVMLLQDFKIGTFIVSFLYRCYYATACAQKYRRALITENHNKHKKIGKTGKKKLRSKIDGKNYAWFLPKSDLDLIFSLVC